MPQCNAIVRYGSKAEVNAFYINVRFTPNIGHKLTKSGHAPIAVQRYDGGASGVGAQAVILKSETYNFHRLDLTRQAGFIVTVYDEDGLRLAATEPCPTPAAAFAEGRKIVDGKVEGPRK